MSGCASLPDNRTTPDSASISDTAGTALAERFDALTRAYPDQTGVLMLGDGLDAFAARALLAVKAERTLDAQYYLLYDDEVGNAFLGLLSRAADRGVRVRLLLDDILLAKSQDPILAAFDAHPNMEVRIINPFVRNYPRSLQLVTRFDEVSRRMHNKSFIADNKVAVMGGRNIADEYYERNSEVAFGDLDILVAGPVVEQISSTFDAYWNSTRAFNISSLIKQKIDNQVAANVRNRVYQTMDNNSDSKYSQAITDSEFVRQYQQTSLPVYWGEARVVTDSVEKLTHSRERTDLHLSAEMGKLFAASKREIIIFSPYLIPGKEGTEGFGKLSQQGVKLRFLTNSAKANNHAVVHAHYSKYRRALLENGVELYEARHKDARHGATDDARSQVLHAKIFVFDRKTVFVGSLNMDPRSWIENTEIGVLIESTELAEAIAGWFDDNVNNVAYRLRLRANDKKIEWITGQGAVTETEPDTTLWERLKFRTMSVLPLEPLL